MGGRKDRAYSKLASLVPAGNQLVAAVSIQNCWDEDSDGGPGRGLEEYWQEHGLEVGADALRDAAYGFFGVTEDRVLLAKEAVSAMFGSVKPKHVMLDASAAECELVWYDRHFDKVRGSVRIMHLLTADRRFATARVMLPGFGAGRDTAMAGADAVVVAFAGRATFVAEPPDTWP